MNTIRLIVSILLVIIVLDLLCVICYQTTALPPSHHCWVPLAPINSVLFWLSQFWVHTMLSYHYHDHLFVKRSMPTVCFTHTLRHETLRSFGESFKTYLNVSGTCRGMSSYQKVATLFPLSSDNPGKTEALIIYRKLPFMSSTQTLVEIYNNQGSGPFTYLTPILDYWVTYT